MSNSWRLLGASVTGRSHETRGLPNQDALAAATAASGNLLLAVADGAGSATRSEEGARVACETAIKALGAVDHDQPESALRHALDKAAQAVHSVARRAGKPARDYACTLLLVLVTPEQVSGLQLGDGAIVCSGAGQIDRLTPGWRSTHAGETVFVTSPGARELATVASREASSTSGVALLTDGLEPVATSLDTGQPFSPFFAPLFSFTAATRDAGGQALRSRQLTDLLGSERIRSRTHDDTTLLLASRTDPEGA